MNLIDQLGHLNDPDALAHLASACVLAGFNEADLQALINDILAGKVTIGLYTISDGPEAGRQFWLVEPPPGTWPPENWTLPLWRSRLHREPCRRCGHHGEDPQQDCPCTCHAVVQFTDGI